VGPEPAARARQADADASASRGGQRRRGIRRPRGQGPAAARRRARARGAGARRGARSPRPGAAAGPRSGHTPAPQTRTPAGATAPRATAAGRPPPRPPARPQRRPSDNRGSPSGSRRQQPVIREQRSPGRRDEGSQPLQQLQRLEQQRRGAVAPGPAKLIPELPTRALRESLQDQGRAQNEDRRPDVRRGRCRRRISPACPRTDRRSGRRQLDAVQARRVPAEDVLGHPEGLVGSQGSAADELVQHRADGAAAPARGEPEELREPRGVA
jgi:hypothetical protein